MNRTYDIVVIGAGITGASVAHYLNKKKAGRILLVDRGDAASDGTGKSAAIVRSFYTIPVMARLAREAVKLFHALKDEVGSDGGFQATGFTQIFPEEWVRIAKEKVAMHQTLGIETDFVPEADWAKRFPWLNTEGVAAIVFESQSGFADPVQTTEAFVNTFVKAGGAFRPRTPVRQLVREGNAGTGVILDDGPVRAGAVVNAAGPWARFLAQSAGLDLPIVAVREQDTIWEVRGDRPFPTTPVSNGIEAAYMRPMGEGRWLLGRGYPKPYFEVDPYNFKTTADDDFVSDLFDRWCKRIPPLQGARLLHAYVALYDVTPDWVPFMGPRTGISGYYDASGGSGHAFKTGPIFARELADWIVDGRVRDDFRQFSYDRVAAGKMFQQSLGGNRV
ncbi:MAG: FAD-binding oxidoreductase [Proteobacteria bacterium]|nr:FAD-binding oxidoreductase [Pseudomonadota bacterium]